MKLEQYHDSTVAFGACAVLKVPADDMLALVCIGMGFMPLMPCTMHATELFASNFTSVMQLVNTVDIWQSLSRL